METTKEIETSGLELQIKKPVMAKDGTVTINGNFTEVAEKIKAVVDQYKGTILTEDNVTYVKSIKSQFVSLRTSIERERKEYKKVYITPHSKLIDSMCDQLQQLVAEGESSLTLQLEEYDNKRKEELTTILKDYISMDKELTEEEKAKIVLKKEYYNKTQKEEDTYDDIDAQIAALKQAKKDREVAIMLIESELEGTNIPSQLYIRQLEYHNATEVILQIKADKKRMEEEKKAKDVVIEKATSEVYLPEGQQDNNSAEVPVAKSEEGTEEIRTRVMQIWYTSSQAEKLNKFFAECDIKFKFVK